MNAADSTAGLGRAVLRVECADKQSSGLRKPRTGKSDCAPRACQDSVALLVRILINTVTLGNSRVATPVGRA